MCQHYCHLPASVRVSRSLSQVFTDEVQLWYFGMLSESAVCQFLIFH